jgi:hypothetical protein
MAMIALNTVVLMMKVRSNSVCAVPGKSLHLTSLPRLPDLASWSLFDLTYFNSLAPEFLSRGRVME